jgi:hypothetical protein
MDWPSSGWSGMARTEPVMDWPSSGLVGDGPERAGDGLAVLGAGLGRPRRSRCWTRRPRGWSGTAQTESVMDWPSSGVVGDGRDGAGDGLAVLGARLGRPRRSR